MAVTAALVVAGGASCLSLRNNNVRSPEAMSGGQSVVYKTESSPELKSNKWETAETAFVATTDFESADDRSGASRDRFVPDTPLKSETRLRN